jgi:putative oxidoreductase
MNNTFVNAGRITFAIPFLFFGIVHFMNAQSMGGMIPGFLPGDAFWIYLTGIAHILAAIAILIKKWVKIATILLAVMLLIFALAIHLPGFLQGNQMELGNVLKNIALAGGALVIGGLYDK